MAAPGESAYAPLAGGDGAPRPRLGWLLVRLCSVGFFVNFQPSEPFLTYYLEHAKGLSADVLNARVWPCDAYGAVAFTLPAALLAERVGQSPRLTRRRIFLSVLAPCFR